MSDANKPKYRNLDPVPPSGMAFDVAPLDGYAACVVVELAAENTLWLRLYVSTKPGSAETSASYTPKGAISFYVVDIPDKYAIDLSAIRQAIIAGVGPNLPPGPPNWGTHTP